MKTLAELEAESPEGFRNPARSAAQEARSTEIRARKRAYEEAHTPLDTSSDDGENDESTDD
jgi:hypothetical protein